MKADSAAAAPMECRNTKSKYTQTESVSAFVQCVCTPVHTRATSGIPITEIYWMLIAIMTSVFSLQRKLFDQSLLWKRWWREFLICLQNRALLIIFHLLQFIVLDAPGPRFNYSCASCPPSFLFLCAFVSDSIETDAHRAFTGKAFQTFTQSATTTPVTMQQLVYDRFNYYSRTKPNKVEYGPSIMSLECVMMTSDSLSYRR